MNKTHIINEGKKYNCFYFLSCFLIFLFLFFIDILSTPFNRFLNRNIFFFAEPRLNRFLHSQPNGKEL